MKDLKQLLYERVLSELDLSEDLPDEDVYRVIDRVMEEDGRILGVPVGDRLKYREAIFASLRKLDILSVIMGDKDITEIMVNGVSQIYIEKNGQLMEYPDRFMSEEKLMDVIQQIASRVNRRVNEASPLADARLPDGSRVNLVLPPAAVDGPSITIRRFPKEPVSMEQLISWGSITREAADFLKTLVICGYNIFVSGGTGAGKTTFLGALAEFIPDTERIITIEDSAELRLKNVRNLVRLESRPANLEGEYEITIRDLLKNALRMRPDRIIVGEVRGAECESLLQAVNTGHDGSMSTGHANSARDMLSRLEMMVLMGMEIPVEAIRSQIASGFEILIHLTRLRDSSRRVAGIYEITGFKDHEIVTKPLYEFEEEGEENGRVIGALKKSGHTLSRTEKLRAGGFTV